MADNISQRSDDGVRNPGDEEGGGRGQEQGSPTKPSSRSPSMTSAGSNASKSSFRKETKPEVHRAAPPVPVSPPRPISVRTSKYDNTYDDIPISEGEHRQEQQQPFPPARVSVTPTLETQTHVHTPRVSVQYSKEPVVPHMDLSDRDPTHMNDDVKVEFDDLFAEPDGAHSIDCVWLNSAVVFTKTKYWCYRILTAIFAIPCAFCWGVSFACLTCGFVWNVRPLIRRYAIEIIP